MDEDKCICREELECKYKRIICHLSYCPVFIKENKRDNFFKSLLKNIWSKKQKKKKI